MINKLLQIKLFSFFFCHKSKAGLCLLWRTRKKAIWRKLLSIQNAAISVVAKRSKELWLVQGYHATVKLDSKVASPVMKTYSESRTELQNLQNFKENTGKVKSVFAIRAALWAEKFWRCLENCSKWKNTLGKLAVVVNLEAIRFEFWMKGALVTIKICVLCGWWFSNQSEVVSETPFSRDTVGREL